MRARILIGTALVGVGALIVRTLGPKLRERLMARCEEMFERMPDDFPPKRILRGIEETRANTTRILEVLEDRTDEPGEPALPDASSTETVGDAAR